MANAQPRTGAELQSYHEQVSAAMATLDTLPRDVRVLIHEYGVPATQHAIAMCGMRPDAMARFLAKLRADRQAQLLSA